MTVSEEVMGVNPEEYNETGLGYGHSFDGILKHKGEGKFALHYDLGIDIETDEALLVPSKEQLEKLENNAIEATLIVMLGG